MSPLRVLRLVPWFLIGFVVAAGLNSAGVIPYGSHASLQRVSVFLVAVALSAIGLSTDVPALRKAGPRPVLLGALLWITVAIASLGLQTLPAPSAARRQPQGRLAPVRHQPSESADGVRTRWRPRPRSLRHQKRFVKTSPPRFAHSACVVVEDCH